MATSQEVTEANLTLAKAQGLSVDQAANLERLKIRLEFLEAQIGGPVGTASVSGFTGYVGSVTLHHTEAEKDAMRKEIELIRAQIAIANNP